jgi:hypothetical protein
MYDVEAADEDTARELAHTMCEGGTEPADMRYSTFRDEYLECTVTNADEVDEDDEA